MLDQHLVAPHAFLEVRILNADSAGLITERLCQENLSRLADWYDSHLRRYRGAFVGRSLPVLDAWLTCIEQSLVAEEDEDLSVWALSAINIVSGLVAGYCAIDEANAEELFHVNETMDKAMLRIQGMPARAQILTAQTPQSLGVKCGHVMSQLSVMAPGWNLLNAAAGNLANHLHPRLHRPRGDQWPRFLFCVGLLGAGLGLPPANAGRDALHHRSESPRG